MAPDNMNPVAPLTWCHFTVHNMWGTTAQTRASAPTHAGSGAGGWSFPEHNPCPDGWHVPTRWEWGDIFGGVANTDGFQLTGTAGQTLGTVNHWHWRNADPLNGSARGVGGRIIYSQIAGSQARIFLPAAGWRSRIDGDVDFVGVSGFFWSSTDTWVTQITNAQVRAGTGNASRAWGASIRCVR